MGNSSVLEKILLEVKSCFVEEYSDHTKQKYFYIFELYLVNQSPKKIKMIDLNWKVIDADGQESNITDEKAIKESGFLWPGEDYHYRNEVTIQKEFGTMDGTVIFDLEDEQKLIKTIPRLFLSPLHNNIKKNQFQIGEIISHKKYHYEGVIVDFEMYYHGSKAWYDNTESKPAKIQPWYHILVHQSKSITYVAESNLNKNNHLEKIIHPLMPFFFVRKEGNYYLRNNNRWEDLMKNE